MATKKEELQQLLTDLKALINQSREADQLEGKIDEIEGKIDEIKEEGSDADQIKNQLDQIINNLPRGISDKLVYTSSILTPLLVIGKIAYDFYWDKIKTPQNLDSMLEKVKDNLEADKKEAEQKK